MSDAVTNRHQIFKFLGVGFYIILRRQRNFSFMPVENHIQIAKINIIKNLFKGWFSPKNANFFYESVLSAWPYITNYGFYINMAFKLGSNNISKVIFN